MGLKGDHRRQKVLRAVGQCRLFLSLSSPQPLFKGAQAPAGVNRQRAAAKEQGGTPALSPRAEAGCRSLPRHACAPFVGGSPEGRTPTGNEALDAPKLPDPFWGGFGGCFFSPLRAGRSKSGRPRGARRSMRRSATLKPFLPNSF